MLLGEPITAADVASIDPDFAQHHLGTLLQDDGVARMEALLFDQLRFVGAAAKGSGEDESGDEGNADVELVKGGRQRRVTERNKRLCVATSDCTRTF